MIAAVVRRLARMTPFPGSITDVQGLKVGHHTDTRRPTGCTVVLCEAGVACGVDVRGAAPGTRETDLLAPGNLVDKVHALLLAGGSAFGLDAAGGVMRWLDEHGHGLRSGRRGCRSCRPRCCSTCGWAMRASVPMRQAGFAACEAATDAATGARQRRRRRRRHRGQAVRHRACDEGRHRQRQPEVEGVRIAALVAVNAAGDVIDPATARVVAGSRQLDGRTPRRITAALARGVDATQLLAGAATTIGIVATDAALDKAQCCTLATMSHDGLARCIDPVHTASDGDTMFALATGAPRARCR